MLPASKSKAHVAYVGVSEFSTDNTQGTLEKTGNVFDLALDGEGYFSVQTPSGIRYTRKGNFQLDSQGSLTTQNGLPVLTAQGEPLVIQGGGGDITPEISRVDVPTPEILSNLRSTTSRSAGKFRGLTYT